VIFSGIFDPSFWTRLVPQATHHEPAIRHAGIALGALHDVLSREEPSEPSIFAMRSMEKLLGVWLSLCKGNKTGC
jgi:hypothetical protein